MSSSIEQTGKPGGEHPGEVVPETCPTCGTEFHGPFCHACGEKRISTTDLDLRHYAKTLLEDFTHLDSKLLRTVRLLLLQPGELSVAYIEGRRTRYIKPFQLFLFVNLFFFFLFSDSDVFAPRLEFVYDSDAGVRLWSGLPVKTWVDNYAANNRMSVEVAISLLDNEISNLTKGMLYAFVPFLGIAFWGLFYRRDRPLLSHLIFATHWFTFFILFIMGCGFALVMVLRVHGMVLLLLLLSALLPVHLMATRRFYGGSWWSLFVKAVLFFGCFTLVYFLYRSLVLFVVYWSV